MAVMVTPGGPWGFIRPYFFVALGSLDDERVGRIAEAEIFAAEFQSLGICPVDSGLDDPYA